MRRGQTDRQTDSKTHIDVFVAVSLEYGIQNDTVC